VATGLRLCANFRDKLMFDEKDLEPDEDGEEGELGERALGLLADLKARYVRLTDGIARNRTLPAKEGFTGDGVISDYAELVLVHQYLGIERQEREQFRLMGDALEDVPIYVAWLDQQKGVGPAMGGVLVTYFNVHKAIYPSQFWAFAGLDVGPDNKGRCRIASHLVERQYTAKDGSTKKKMSTTFDPWLQSKMLGVFGQSLLRAGSPYKKCYDDYKHRISTDPARVMGTLLDKKNLYAAGRKEEADAIWHKWRIHRAASRYMVKMFIKDFWKAWRELEGLPIVPSYHEAVMGHRHHAA